MATHISVQSNDWGIGIKVPAQSHQLLLKKTDILASATGADDAAKTAAGTAWILSQVKSYLGDDEFAARFRAATFDLATGTPSILMLVS